MSTESLYLTELHEEWDRKVRRAIGSASPTDVLPETAGMLLYDIRANCGGLLEPLSLAQRLQWLEKINIHEGILNMLKRSVQNDDYRDVREQVLNLRIPERPPDPSNEPTSQATLLAWDQEFRGETLDSVLSHINIARQTVSIYTPFCSLIGPSGMGKSRTAHELSKRMLVVPMCLRNPSIPGFPPSDQQLHEYLCRDMQHINHPVVVTNALLIALFEVLMRWYMEHKGAMSLPFHLWFAQIMSEGQTLHRQGAKRRRFFDEVIQRAKELNGMFIRRARTDVATQHPESTESTDDLPPPLSFESGERGDPITLLGVAIDFHELYKLTEPKLRGEVMLVFDESNELTLTPGPRQYRLYQQTIDSALRQALRSVRCVPIFSLHISTNAKIPYFAPPKAMNPSDQIQSGEFVLAAPFLAFGIDEFSLTLPNPYMFKDVGHTYQAHLGRPLFATRCIAATKLPPPQGDQVIGGLVQFAANKLLGRELASEPRITSLNEAFAVLAQRLPLEFMHTYTTTEDERIQIETHMRVCLSVSEDRRRIRTISPSEPILSEGAAHVMTQTTFPAASFLLNILTSFAIHQGDRGELVALLLLTLARDRVSRQNSTSPSLNSLDHNIPAGFFKMVDFLPALLRIPESSNDIFMNILEATPSVYRTESEKKVLLKEAFADVYVHFNHFIKPLEQDDLDFGTLQEMFARNAAVLYATNQRGIDVAMPTIKGHVVVKTAASLFVIKLKNDTNYSAAVQEDLFHSMNPVTLGLINEDEVLPVPLIRMVLCLAGEWKTVKFVSEQRKGNFTSYDIWVSGVDNEVFSVIQPDDNDTWGQLLRPQEWKKEFEPKRPEVNALLKTLMPSALREPSFRTWFKQDPPAVSQD